jgi:CheY-like chemotaxis protein
MGDDMTQLLVIDDDRNLTRLISEVATELGYSVQVVNQADKFETAYSETPPDIIALDVFMPDMDGFEVLRHLHDRGCTARVILLSGAENYLHMAQEVAAMGGIAVAGVLAKPFRVSELRRMLGTAASA